MSFLYKEYKYSLWLYFLCFTIFELMILVQIFIGGLILNTIIIEDKTGFWFWIYMILATSIGIIVFLCIKLFLKSVLQKKITIKLKKDLLNKIENYKNSKNEIPSGKMISLFFKTIPEIINNKILIFDNFISSALVIVATLGIIFYYFWLIGLITIISLFFLLISWYFLPKKFQRIFLKKQNNRLKYDNLFNSYIESYDKFFHYDQVLQLGKILEETNEKYTKNVIGIEKKYACWLTPFVVMYWLFLILMYLVTSLLYKNSLLEAQIFLTLPFFFNILATKTQLLMNSFANFHAYSKISNELIFNNKKNSLKNSRLKIEKIELKNFNIKMSNHLYKNNLNIRFLTSHLTLIRGPSGIGKSTIFRAIYDNQLNYEGEILINGLEIKNFNLKNIFQEISFITNDSKLLPGNVKQNLTSYKDISKDELLKILKIVNLKRIYLRKNITKLSSGEKQKVALGSYLVKKPRWIFLDESLSNLDQNNCDLIIRNLVDNNFSVVYISHSKHINERIYDQIINIS